MGPITEQPVEDKLEQRNRAWRCPPQCALPLTSWAAPRTAPLPHRRRQLHLDVIRIPKRQHCNPNAPSKFTVPCSTARSSSSCTADSRSAIFSTLKLRWSSPMRFALNRSPASTVAPLAAHHGAAQLSPSRSPLRRDRDVLPSTKRRPLRRPTLQQPRPRLLHQILHRILAHAGIIFRPRRLDRVGSRRFVRRPHVHRDRLA